MISATLGNLGAVRRIPLDRDGLRWALLREPRGLDEEGVADRSTFEAIRLIDRLLVDSPGTAAPPGSAAELTVPERDLLLAAVWRMARGPRIEGTLTCAACSSPFDYDFNLDDLVTQVLAALAQFPFEGGVYTLPDGCRFRLPTGEDERELIGLPDDEAERVLLARCLVAGDSLRDGNHALAAMEQIGAGADIELELRCTECGHLHGARFQIQNYLLGSLLETARDLVEDTHRLALAYRWSLSEILALPIRRRRAFVALLAGDAVPSLGEPA
jgi:hypothetical protein